MINIDAIEAGPELDRLVALTVLGWRWEIVKIDPRREDKQVWGWRQDVPNGGNNYRTDYEPSTNIADAWIVVERITKGGHDFSVDLIPPSDWRVWTNMPKGQGAEAEADTAPLAICRAALKALKAARSRND